MKARPNKLDPFADRLDEWTLEGKTLAQMQEALRLDGCSTSLSSLSDFLSRRRTQKDEAAMFGLIASGGKMNKELDAAFKENPAPGIDRLIDVSKSLVMQLQVKGAADPSLLNIANSMQQTVLTFISGQTKAALESRKLELGERKVVLLEKKAAQADAAEGVVNSGLSAEDQAQRLREIFKKANP